MPDTQPMSAQQFREERLALEGLGVNLADFDRAARRINECANSEVAWSSVVLTQEECQALLPVLSMHFSSRFR